MFAFYELIQIKETDAAKVAAEHKDSKIKRLQTTVPPSKTTPATISGTADFATAKKTRPLSMPERHKQKLCPDRERTKKWKSRQARYRMIFLQNKRAISGRRAWEVVE